MTLGDNDPLTPPHRLIHDAENATAATIRDRLLTGLATVDTHITNIEGASTPAQQKAALLFALRGLKQLARLELHELGSAD